MDKKILREFLDKVPLDEKLIKRAEDDIIMADDGYYVYWPLKLNGFLSEHHLLQLLKYINTKNREWDDGVDEFFKC